MRIPRVPGARRCRAGDSKTGLATGGGQRQPGAAEHGAGGKPAAELISFALRQAGAQDGAFKAPSVIVKDSPEALRQANSVEQGLGAS